MWLAYFVFCGLQYGKMVCHSSHAPTFFKTVEACELYLGEHLYQNEKLWREKGHPPVAFKKTGCGELAVNS